MNQLLKIFCIATLILGTLSCKNKSQEVNPPDDGGNHYKPLSLSDCKKCMVLAEQSQPAVDIVDAARGGQLMWQWRPIRSNISFKEAKWFKHIDEVKPVYDNKYILITSSLSGGLALIRIADKKAVFYAQPGKQPHSAEILPDGNIVVALSTGGDKLALYDVDTTGLQKSYENAIDFPFAHNIVWDKKRKVLWATSNNKLYSFKYNFDCTDPDLTPQDTVSLPGNNAHDLFPVYGKDALWLSNSTGTYQIDLSTMQISRANTDYQKSIKSVSSGPPAGGWPTIIQKPTKSYWADEIIDFEGNVVFKHPGWKIYKARWFLPNLFSYPKDDEMKVCSE